MKVVTINFWGTEPPLDKRLALAARQLRALAPDVVCMQEARQHTADDEDGEADQQRRATARGGQRPARSRALPP